MRTEVTVDLDIDDIYYDLCDREKKELAEMLEEDGFVIISRRNINEVTSPSAIDYEWHEVIDKINKSRYLLTSDQEQMLIDLSKKL
jgi:hypothetical protein